MGDVKMNTRLYSQEPTKSKIIHRLKIVKGHLEKVLKMVEEDAYCIDVINQSQAVQAALKKIDREILENHLYCCVLGEVDKANSQNKKLVSEIVSVFKKSQG